MMSKPEANAKEEGAVRNRKVGVSPMRYFAATMGGSGAGLVVGVAIPPF